MAENARKWSGDWRPDIAVQCPRKTQGCTWKGDFRHIPYHESECAYGDSVLVKELCRRMDQWEGVMKAKVNFCVFISIPYFL